LSDDAEVLQILARSAERFDIDHSQSKLVNVVLALSPLIVILPQEPVASNKSAKISAPIVFIDRRRGSKGPYTHELVAGRKKRPLALSAFGACDEFPTAVGKESMVRASNELGPVMQIDPVCRLHNAPLGVDSRPNVNTATAMSLRTVEGISNL
jgi:hypothetical protein